MGFFLLGFLFISGGVGLCWAYYNYKKLMQIECKEPYKGQQNGSFNDHKLLQQEPSVIDIGHIIQEGASQFIKSQYKICSIFIILMAAVVFLCVDRMEKPYTTIAFIIGALTSMFCGAFGMKIATLSNFRTTIAAQKSLGLAFQTAYKAGCVMGFTLVSIAMLVLLILLLVYKKLYELDDSSSDRHHYSIMFEAVAGYGLGGSTIALFARVGGGIYTKAADIGSDLVGKLQQGLPQDSPKNPATIADNVGDNVGDVAGMSADLFGSFAQATCAALVIGGNSILNQNQIITFDSFIGILCIPALGILCCALISAIITEGNLIQQNIQVQGSLKRQLIYSTCFLFPFLSLNAYLGYGQFKMYDSKNQLIDHSYTHVIVCVTLGAFSGLLIGTITEIMTSYSYKPVKQLADACRTGAATNIIYGLALGYLSTIVPVISICIVCYFSHILLGFYGVALGALGMLANLPIILAIDGYGPISDNAGGIAQMAELPPQIRQRTDVLDSAGNTTAAIGKGGAIGSAILVGFSLYGAFLHQCYHLQSVKKDQISFDDPSIFTALLFGAMMPYAFSALTMKSVGQAAKGMIQEVRRQVRQNPGILDGSKQPDYKSCVRISTESSLKEMILPGLLVTVTPFALGLAFGPKCLLGFLPGAMVSGVQMAISASNTGGAWDNAKKYIEAGLMSHNHEIVKKGSDIHQAAVIGDTVGDPLKDTSGPSLNILIKLMAILSLVFCRYFSPKHEAQ